MTDEPKILTRHPLGKRGFRIGKKQYDLVRAAILASLKQRRDLTFTLLVGEVEKKLGKSFDGAPLWYSEVVKLDLEAHGLIERYQEGSKVLYRLKPSNKAAVRAKTK